MRRFTIALALAALFVGSCITTPAFADEVPTATIVQERPEMETWPCKTNNAVRAIRCLSHERGLHVNTRTALQIAKCESGVGRFPTPKYAPVYGPYPYKYQGVYQLLQSEFDSFQHQSKKAHWIVVVIKQENYNINDSWANVAATFAHVQRYGWGFIGECH